MVKNLPTMKEMRVQSMAVKIPWRRKWQPTPVYLPEKSYGQRSLVGYRPKGHKRVKHDLATKQQQNNLCLYLCTFSIQQPNLTHPKPNLMTPTLYTQHTHTHTYTETKSGPTSEMFISHCFPPCLFC